MSPCSQNICFLLQGNCLLRIYSTKMSTQWCCVCVFAWNMFRGNILCECNPVFMYYTNIRRRWLGWIAILEAAGLWHPHSHQRFSLGRKKYFGWGKERLCFLMNDNRMSCSSQTCVKLRPQSFSNLNQVLPEPKYNQKCCSHKWVLEFNIWHFEMCSQ